MSRYPSAISRRKSHKLRSSSLNVLALSAWLVCFGGQQPYPKLRNWGLLLVLVVVLGNPDRFTIRITEQNNCWTIGLFSAENADPSRAKDNDESKLRNLG